MKLYRSQSSNSKIDESTNLKIVSERAFYGDCECATEHSTGIASLRASILRGLRVFERVFYVDCEFLSELSTGIASF